MRRIGGAAAAAAVGAAAVAVAGGALARRSVSSTASSGDGATLSVVLGDEASAHSASSRGATAAASTSTTTSSSPSTTTNSWTAAAAARAAAVSLSAAAVSGAAIARSSLVPSAGRAHAAVGAGAADAAAGGAAPTKKEVPEVLRQLPLPTFTTESTHRLFGDAGAIRWQRFYAIHQQNSTAVSSSSSSSSSSSTTTPDFAVFESAANTLLRDATGLMAMASAYDAAAGGSPPPTTDKEVQNPEIAPEVLQHFVTVWLSMQCGFLAELFRSADDVAGMFDLIKLRTGAMELPDQHADAEEAVHFALFMSGSAKARAVLEQQVREAHPTRPAEYHRAILSGLIQRYEQRLQHLAQGDWPELLAITLGSYFVSPDTNNARGLLQHVSAVSAELHTIPQPGRRLAALTLVFIIHNLLQDPLARGVAATMIEEGAFNVEGKPGWATKVIEGILAQSR